MMLFLMSLIDTGISSMKIFVFCSSDLTRRRRTSQKTKVWYNDIFVDFTIQHTLNSKILRTDDLNSIVNDLFWKIIEITPSSKFWRSKLSDIGTIIKIAPRKISSEAWDVQTKQNLQKPPYGKMTFTSMTKMPYRDCCKICLVWISHASEDISRGQFYLK